MCSTLYTPSYSLHTLILTTHPQTLYTPSYSLHTLILSTHPHTLYTPSYSLHTLTLWTCLRLRAPVPRNVGVCGRRSGGAPQSVGRTTGSAAPARSYASLWYAQPPANDSFFLMMGSVGTEWICKERRIITRGLVVPQPLVKLITTLSRVITSTALCRFTLSSSP